jgi:nucleotide-binding universal stress UspA family protein
MEKIRSILVPVRSGGIDDEEAIRSACAIAKRDKASVAAIYVIEVARALPLDAEVPEALVEGERALEHAAALAETLECEVETVILQARTAGPAIVDEAVDHGVDLIVMGLPYRTRFGEFYLGSTAFYVLKHAPCRIWMCRVDVEEKKKP